jgi:tetratricopeptide (TPR) repeat protein
MMKQLVFIVMSWFLFFSFSACALENNDTPAQISEEAAKDKLLLEKKPDDPVILNRLGFNLYRLGFIDEAFNLFKQSIKIDPNIAVPYNNLGIIYLQRKEFNEAEINFKQAFKLDPKYSKPLYNLAVTYFHEKKYWLALKTYVKTKNMDGNYVKERDNKDKIKKEVNEQLKEDPDNGLLRTVAKELQKEKK